MRTSSPEAEAGSLLCPGLLIRSSDFVSSFFQTSADNDNGLESECRLGSAKRLTWLVRAIYLTLPNREPGMQAVNLYQSSYVLEKCLRSCGRQFPDPLRLLPAVPHPELEQEQQDLCSLG